jgi:hypothetical protein
MAPILMAAASDALLSSVIYTRLNEVIRGCRKNLSCPLDFRCCRGKPQWLIDSEYLCTPTTPSV